MDKSFYVIPTGKDTAAAHVCYCGRCGKRQLLDHYNVQKHEESCIPMMRLEQSLKDNNWNPMIGLQQIYNQQASNSKTDTLQTKSSQTNTPKPVPSPGSGSRADSKKGISIKSSSLRPIGYRPLPDDVVIVEEKNYWGYRLDAAEPDGGAGGVLSLSICIPILIKIPGFTDRFSGMEWVPVFVAEFLAGAKNPRVLRNETGFTMEVLLAMIRAGRISSISMESDREVIRRVFPGVIDVYSLEMFAYIYRNKGYATDVRIRPGTESWLFENTPSSKEWKALGVYEEKTEKDS